MRFDKLVEELLEKNTIEESSWKQKLGMGAAAGAALLGFGAGALNKGGKPKETPQRKITAAAEPTQTETQRRIAAAEAMSKGKTPAPRYKDTDQSPEAKKHRANMKKIEAAQRLSQGR